MDTAFLASVSPASLFFLIVLTDAAVNAPPVVPSKAANAAVFAVAAVLVVVFGLPGFAFVQAVLAAMLALQYAAKPPVVAVVPAAPAAEEAKAPDANLLPAAVEAFMAQCLKAFEANLDDKTSSDDKPWALVGEVKLTNNSIKIFQTDIPKQGCKRWKVEAEVAGTRDQLFDQLFDYAKRPSWDTTLASGSVIKSYQCGLGGSIEVSLYYTAPAAGGAVSSRELADVGLVIKDEQGGITYVNASLPNDLQRHVPSIPTKVKGVRGFTLPGSGMRLIPIPGSEKGTSKVPTRFKYILCNGLVLGGWLPVSLVNSATTQALTDGTRTMCEHMESIAAKNPPP